jgi:hypothetical protein
MPARTITHDGITLTIAEWAERTNQMPRTLRWRLNAGWPIEQALQLPLQPAGSNRQEHVELRDRIDRRVNAKALQIRNEFSKLVFALDNALRTFRESLDTLLPDEDTGGWVNQPAESPPNRTIPSVEDSSELEIS